MCLTQGLRSLVRFSIFKVVNDKFAFSVESALAAPSIIAISAEIREVGFDALTHTILLALRSSD